MEIIVSIVGTLVATLGLLRYFNKDTKEAATENTKVSTKLDYIAKSVDEIRIDFKTQDRRITEVESKVIRLEESTKSAHKRIDYIEEEK